MSLSHKPAHGGGTSEAGQAVRQEKPRLLWYLVGAHPPLSLSLYLPLGTGNERLLNTPYAYSGTRWAARNRFGREELGQALKKKARVK